MRLAFRRIRQEPIVSLSAILIVAVAIGAVTSVFSLANSFFLRALPFERPGELVQISDVVHGSEATRPVTAATYLEWRTSSRTLAALGAYHFGNVLITDDEPTRITFARVSVELLDLLGVEPLLGRRFEAEEASQGRERVAVISEALWRSRFAASGQALGETISMEGDAYTIVGVLPSRFKFPQRYTQIWIPLPLERFRDRPNAGPELLVLGRLAPGASVDAVRAELSARVVPLREGLLRGYGAMADASVLVFVGVGFVLFVVCANVGALFLARALARQRELSIRAALGGTRSRLMTELLVEVSVLCFCGGAIGVLLARSLALIVNARLGDELYRVGTVEVDSTAFVFTLGVSIVSALLSGVAPAFAATRGGAHAMAGRLQNVSRGGHHRFALRDWLVTGQVAAAVLLVAASLQLGRALTDILAIDPGFDEEHLLAVELELPITTYPSASDHERFYDEVSSRVRRLAGVRDASYSNPLPFGTDPVDIRAFNVPGLPTGTDEDAPEAMPVLIGPAYFATMGIPLIRGRTFTSTDDERGPEVVVVNRSMAETYWPGIDPVGRTLAYAGSPERSLTIVGVAGDSRQVSLDEAPVPVVYFPMRQVAPRKRFLLVRTEGEPLDQAALVRDIVRSVDERAPIPSIRTVASALSESLLVRSYVTTSLLAFGAFAVVLAALGIYSAVSGAVSRRRLEIAVRSALGAAPKQNLSLMLRRSTRLTVLGIACGLAATVPFAGLTRAFLIRLQRFDLVSLMQAAVLLFLVGLVSASLPAIRCVRRSPADTLRS